MDKEMSVEITVIVPVYNRAYCLNQCLDSIKNQTFENWECILVDDGSTDNSLAVCRKYAAEDIRFHVYHQSNQGVSTARNKGLDMAQGIYIHFVDSDDTIEDDCLLKLLEAIADSDLSVGGLKFFDMQNCFSYSNVFRSELILLNNEYLDVFIELYGLFLLNGPVCKLYKRSVIEANHLYFENMHLGEDQVFNLSYLKCIHSIRTIPYKLYNVVETSVSLSRNKAYESFALYEKIWLAEKSFFKEKYPLNRSADLYICVLFLQMLYRSLRLVLYQRKELTICERYAYIKRIIKHCDTNYLTEKKINFQWGAFFNRRYFIVSDHRIAWLSFEILYLLRRKQINK